MRQERAPESDEAEVRVCESALSRAEEERPAAVCYLRAGQSVSESQETAAGNGVDLLARAPPDERSNGRVGSKGPAGDTNAGFS